MSLFLGPIHYQLYNKIKYLNSLTNKLIDLYDLNLDDYPTSIDYSKKLDEVIDENQIHAWLSFSVDEVENKHASVLNSLFCNNVALEELKKFYFKLGKEIPSHSFNTVYDVFEVITSYLLDGMPCDGGIIITSQIDDQIIFEYNSNVHSNLISFDIFQSLRIEWINGLIANTSFELLVLNNTTFMLKEKF